MLDKQTNILLNYFNESSQDGAYKVLEKNEMINSFPKKYKVDDDSLKSMIEHLEERNYINVKYSDDKVYCLAVLPKGRLFKEKMLELKKEQAKYNKLIITTMSLSCVAAFVGAFCAMILYNILF